MAVASEDPERTASTGWTRSRPASARWTVSADVKAEEIYRKAGHVVFLAEERRTVQNRISERRKRDYLVHEKHLGSLVTVVVGLILFEIIRRNTPSFIISLFVQRDMGIDITSITIKARCFESHWLA